MGKLLTTGCSFVWGDELDGYDNNPPTHWDKTFTYKLADTLGLEPVIIAECGNSNHKIYRDLIDYLTDPENDDPEMIFVSWSHLKDTSCLKSRKRTSKKDRRSNASNI